MRNRKIVVGIMVSSLILLTGCNAKTTPSITQTCQAYLMGVKQTVAGAYPNTLAGNKSFLSQMQSIKDLADASAVPELRDSADAMFKAVQTQDKAAFTAAGQRLFDTCKNYGFNSLK